MKIKILLIIKLVALSLALSASANEEPPNLKQNLTSSNEQLKKWYQNTSIPLRDNYGNLTRFNLKESKGKESEVALSIKQKSALSEAINNNTIIFGAKDFDEYHKTLMKMSGGEIKISPDGYHKMRTILVAGNAISRPELLTDYELTEAYWILTTRLGTTGRQFTGIITSESFYKLIEMRNINELKIFKNPFPNDEALCGSVIQTTSFLWCNSDPIKEFEKTGQLLVADIRYMLKTDVLNLAYPVCIRIFWSDDLGKWIPWFCIEYNSTRHFNDVAF